MTNMFKILELLKRKSKMWVCENKNHKNALVFALLNSFMNHPCVHFLIGVSVTWVHKSLLTQFWILKHILLISLMAS